jgi:anti-anti-sigma regulatory factor
VRLRIDVTTEKGHAVFRLIGRLADDGAIEFDRLYRRAEGRVRIDLSDLRSADAAGVDALRGARSAGAELVGTSAYLALLLGVESDAQGPAAPTP